MSSKPTTETLAANTIYLSVSWQADDGKKFGYKVIKTLDENKILAIGDVKGLTKMDNARIRRIMSQAEYFFSVLPYRSSSSSKTSDFMIEELVLAVELNLPIVISYDSRIALKITKIEDKNNIELPGGRIITVEANQLLYCNGYDFGDEISEDSQLIEFRKLIFQLSFNKTNSQPYSFLITRLQDDFELPRHAYKISAELASGITCIYVDSEEYKKNSGDTVEKVRDLIKGAQFVIADVSLTDEGVEVDNPSRAHEIGLAVADEKRLFICSHSPRRNLYHAIATYDLTWWDNEQQLFTNLQKTIYKDREAIGRHIYNYELAAADNKLLPNIAKPIFDINSNAAWTPPASKEFSVTQSWIFAASFAFLAGSTSYILGVFAKYDQALDLIAIFAAIIAFFFSSNVNKKIQKVLFGISYLRWLVPTVAVLLLIACICHKVLK